jgi:hypothetical protein
MTATTIPAREPVAALPARRMVLTVIASTLATIAAWAAVTALLGRTETIVPAAAGATLVAGVSILSLLAIGPWKPREMGSWANLWLAALVGRLLLTPALAYLLYSATPLSLTPLMLSVGVTYVIVQISEAAALAAQLKRLPVTS